MAFIIPNQTSTSLLRPIPSQSGWTRPGDWITITDTAGEVQFLMSDATTPYTAIRTSFTQTGGVGNIYIDWGDGTIDTISTIAATTTNHTYTSGGTPSVLGYNMWKIRVYGDAGTTLTNTSIYWNTNQTTGYIANPSGILEAVYGDGTQTDGFQNLFYAGTSPRPSFPFLTYVKLPSVITTGGFIFNSTFAYCYGLRQVVMPTSAPNATSFTSCFQGCISLSEPIILPQDATLLSSLSNTFNECRTLTSITLPPTLNNNTSMAATFSNCFSLTQIEIPPTPLCFDYSSMLNACRNLLSFEFKAFPVGAAAINMFLTFGNCSALEYIKLPPTAPTNQVGFNNTFQNCSNLKNCVLPSNLNATTFASTFAGCASLASVVLPTSMSGLTSFASTFDGCQTLQEITLPTSVGAATITINTMFRNCNSLTEITIPSTYNLGDCLTAFNNCLNLRTITLPNNTQNSLTNMASAFNGCNNLESVVMPTSMNALVNLQTAFASCQKLKNITFPSSLNATTTMLGTFQNCNNLESVVMPTSMTALTNMNNTFFNCAALKEITLPTSVSASMGTFNPFGSCVSLNNITFPTTQMTGINNINGFIGTCLSLTGMTNMDKIGNPSTAATTYIDGTGNIDVFQLPSLDFYCKFSRLIFTGRAGILTKLTSLRLRNNGSGQYAGSSPQINISYNSLGQAALVQVFNDLPTISAKTINITDNPGAALLTPAERAIATGKGWTIIG